MAETTADVRRDIEMTRDRISDTLQQLEQKTNVMQIVRDHPWPALALAVGTGVLLSGSGTDVKAAAATATATRGASSKIGNVLDDVVANLMGGLSTAFQDRVEALVNELKEAIGAPATSRAGNGSASRSAFTSTGGLGSSGAPAYVASPAAATPASPASSTSSGGTPSGGGFGTGVGGGATGMSAAGPGSAGASGGSESGGWSARGADAMRTD